jgi:DNA-binding response OmpR family regulator
MPKKILIIEDDPVIVKYLQAIFSDNGYASCTAGSSMEARSNHTGPAVAR